MEFKIKRVKYKKKGTICDVVLDNDEVLEINTDLVLKFNMNVGKSFSKESINEILHEHRIMDIKKKAYDYASFKPRSERKVIEKLEKEGFDNEEISTALTFLYKYDLLDDKKFADMYVKDFLMKKNAGKFKLINKLMENGISRDIAEDTVNKQIDENMEYEMAIDELEKLKKQKKDSNSLKMKRFLENRGFSFEIIKKIKEL